MKLLALELRVDRVGKDVTQEMADTGHGMSDPGWGPALSRPHVILAELLPGFGILFTRGLKSSRGPALTKLRQLFLSRLLALGAILLILLAIVDDSLAYDDAVMWSLGVAALGAIDTGLILWARRRPLDVASDEKLRETYVATFFLGTALALSSALVGFVAVFMTDSLIPYLVGVAFAILGFALIAPTRADLARRQKDIVSQGSSLSLVEALESRA